MKCGHCLFEDETTKTREDFKMRFMCDECWTTQSKIRDSDEEKPDSGVDDRGGSLS